MDIGHAACCARHSHGICSKKSPAVTAAEGKGLEPGSSVPHSSPLLQLGNQSHPGRYQGIGAAGISLLLENLWAPRGWILKASDPSWKRGSKQPGVVLIAHHLWGCVHGNVSWWDLRRKWGWLQLSLQRSVCPSPENSCNNIFSCCVPSLECFVVAKAGKVFGVLSSVVWGLPVCSVPFTGNVAALGFPSHRQSPL